jgi:hypothetical protein
MADKYQSLLAGREEMVEATTVSTGVAEAGDIIALDSSGKIDVSLLPTGLGPEVVAVLASETLNAGDFVNIWDNGGTANVRLADSTNDRPAHGWVQAGFAAAATATVYIRKGVNTSVSGLTPGARQYLDASGATTEVPPALPTDVIHQFLGVAVTATSMIVDIEDEIVL